VLFSPLPVPGNHCSYVLKLTVYGKQCCEHVETPLLFLSQAKAAMVKRVFMRSEILSSSLCMLGTNQRGGMLRAHASWGTLNSKYDALLAANLNPDFPEDRWIMFARCRAWVVYQGYSQEISSDCFESFSFDYNSRGFWQYHIPTGQGEDVVILISIEMVDNENAVRITFSRHLDCENSDRLSDAKKVRLILRPDIEDRNFHENTKAFKGPERTWESAVTPFKDSFVFAQDIRRALYVKISHGEFVWEPEWHYAVHRSEDAQRGLDPDSDLFSPGYFATYMEGGQTVELLARVSEDSGDTKTQQLFLCNKTVKDEGLLKYKDIKGWELSDALKQAMDSYVVKRGVLKTVIAGYPWFLDWGRDALIFCRGLITAGRFEDAREILKQFGRFEKDGTLPNMIHGNDARNRDTSDAPLWFFVACKDFVSAKGDDAFLDEVCGSQTIRKILISMGRSLLEGMPNGIRLDAESGLLYSPAHFTWMDTNHPACTSRQGYPIEIQALWYAALSFLSCIDSSESSNWEKIAQQVKKSILELFWLEEEGFLADCLHAREGVFAKEAEIDDALRPNQLFAITLGAVTDNDVCRKIVAACEELLVPGAIRSLSDRPVRYPIEVVYKDNVINDPYHPYLGRYVGDEDTRRKPAYHNGTAWTWPFPAYCEAWFMAYGDKGKAAALALLGSSTQFINQGCAGHVPEIVDGDYPHVPRGCDAQAWGVSELLRVWELLK
jgi:predicted glycogen debranching enzyme